MNAYEKVLTKDQIRRINAALATPEIEKLPQLQKS